MNYAQDRLDRRELQQQLVRESPDHTKYGQLCLRRGWNRHALYHYGRAWYHTPCDGIKLGDYVQMMEIYGYPEIALLTIFFYRTLSSNSAYKSGSQDEEEYLQTLLTPPPQVVDHETEDDDVHHNKNDLSHEEMMGRHCGCRDGLCGRSISNWLPMPHTAMANIIEQLSRYLQEHHSYNNDTFSSFAFKHHPSRTTAATFVPPPTAHELLGDWWSSDRLLQKVTPFITGSQQRIPALFQFWSPDTPTTASSETLLSSHNSVSFQSPPEPTYRTLPSVVQLLAAKLSYLVLPCLAMEAIVHLRYQQQQQQNLSMNDWDQLPIQYKSHWAYYIFLEALVLGERMKPSRRRQLKYQHVALWDRHWGIQLDILDATNDQIDPPQPSSLSSQPDPQQEDNLVHDFIKQLQHLVEEIYQRSDDVDHNGHLPRPMYLTPVLDGSRWSQHHHRPLFFVGDSHVLSLAWQSIHLPTDRMGSITEPRTIVPMVITGLKAWHVRPETRFFTNTCLHTMLRRIPRHVQTIVVSAGEIDCREGMGGQLLQGYTQKCDEHVKATVAAYVSSLVHIIRLPSNSISQILIAPVAPHIERNKGRVVGHASRRETIRVWNDELRCQLQQQHNDTMLYLLDYIDQIQVPIKKSIDIGCSTTCTTSTTNNVQYALNPIFNADSTHMNAAFAPILQEAIIQCQCDLSKL